jgi:nitrite reductase/ring-hydroxylating ferredoxin subunit
MQLRERFPMPTVPNGWYAVLLSRELGRTPVPLHVLDHELVAFRDDAGRPAVLDAFCPHLGTHLGHGGRVVDGELECPFHHWRFDGEGRCTHATSSTTTPRARLRPWHTREQDGILYVWYHAASAVPSWEVPALPRSERVHSKPVHLRWRVATHVQEIRENIGDETHFSVIHKMPRAGVSELVTRGPFATLRFPSRFELLGRALRFDTHCEMAGPGILCMRTLGLVDTRVVVLSTPSDGLTSDLRLLVSATNLGRVPLTRWMIAPIVAMLAKRDVDKEVNIWGHKRYLERPIFVGPERTQREIRSWYRQFYDHG